MIQKHTYDSQKLFICHFHSGATRPIIEIKDGQEIITQAPQHFCYYNSIIPGWRETWTRIQVKYF